MCLNLCLFFYSHFTQKCELWVMNERQYNPCFTAERIWSCRKSKLIFANTFMKWANTNICTLVFLCKYPQVFHILCLGTPVADIFIIFRVICKSSQTDFREKFWKLLIIGTSSWKNLVLKRSLKGSNQMKKGGGSGSWPVFENGFGPGRSMSVYFLMLPSSFLWSFLFVKPK